jgi:hypothetical protein
VEKSSGEGIMFEKLEAGPEVKRFMNKWQGKPKEPSSESRAIHYKSILANDLDFFLATSKMSDTARRSLTERDLEKYHILWELLRDNGWRYFKTREGEPAHWYTIYDKFRPTLATSGPTEADQERWEKEIDEGWQS